VFAPRLAARECRWSNLARIPPLLSFSLAEAAFECLDAEPTLEIHGDINPFVLSGDFNGDRELDYALAVREIKTGKKGFLICAELLSGLSWGLAPLGRPLEKRIA